MIPVGELASEDLAKLFLGKGGDEIIFSADDNSQSICTHAEFDRGSRCGEGSAGFTFAVFDGAGSIGDICFAGLAETLETSASADTVNGDVASVTFLLEEFGHALGEQGTRWMNQR